jgi:hypothetical protein
MTTPGSTVGGGLSWICTIRWGDVDLKQGPEIGDQDVANRQLFAVFFSKGGPRNE